MLRHPWRGFTNSTDTLSVAFGCKHFDIGTWLNGPLRTKQRSPADPSSVKCESCPTWIPTNRLRGISFWALDALRVPIFPVLIGGSAIPPGWALNKFLMIYGVSCVWGYAVFLLWFERDTNRKTNICVWLFCCFSAGGSLRKTHPDTHIICLMLKGEARG